MPSLVHIWKDTIVTVDKYDIIFLIKLYMVIANWVLPMLQSYTLCE